MKRTLIFLFTLFFSLSAYGEAQNNTSFFDITNLTETFFKAEVDKITSNPSENKTQIFNDAVMKYSQGNVTASYDDYSKIIDMTETDFGLLNLAKNLYKMGFFSLADKALNKVGTRKEMEILSNDLKRAGSVKYISHDDEIYLGKALTSVLYDNLASETIFDLNKNKGELLEKSDWANYVMANAYFQTKQYKQALSSINKAISKNQSNNLYILLKLKILTLQENYKLALKFAEKTEKANLIKVPFLDDFVIQKKVILQNLAKDKQEKLLYKAEIEILKDNAYSAKNTLDEIISTDKENQKALVLSGFCDLKLNDLLSAENNFKKAYETKQNYSLALEGIGDVEFVNYRYKNALKYYEKAYKKNKNNSPLINKIILSSIFAQEPETTIKMTKIYSKKDSPKFYDFYNVGTTTAKYVQKDKINLSNEYIKKAISSNPFWNISWLEFALRELENDNTPIVENILEAVYLSRETNYQYYYVNALYNLKKQNREEAIKNLDKVIEINPDFKRAKTLREIIDPSL